VTQQSPNLRQTVRNPRGGVGGRIRSGGEDGWIHIRNRSDVAYEAAGRGAPRSCDA
jgi:hypothetical protein